MKLTAKLLLTAAWWILDPPRPTKQEMEDLKEIIMLRLKPLTTPTVIDVEHTEKKP